MARVGWGRHSTVVTGSNDVTKQVSLNAWNADITNSGMFGYTSSSITVTTNKIIPTDSFTIISGGGTINLITNTNVQDKDLLFLLDGGGGAILAHNQTASGSDEKVMLLSALNKTLSATIPTVLYRLSGVWYEFALNSDLVNSNINANAAIAFSKLAALTSAHILLGNGSNVATDTAVSGDITITNAGVTTIGNNAVTSAKLATTVNVIGKDDIWIPAVAMWTSTTSGATAVAKVETATNKLNIQYMDFPDAANSSAEFTWFTPRNWDASTVKATFVFQVASGGGTNNVKFQLQGVAVRDNVAIDTAWGTGQTATTTSRAAANITVSAQTSAITIGNTPQAGDLVQFRVMRDTTDTETVTARLIGVRIEYGISQATAV